MNDSGGQPSDRETVVTAAGDTHLELAENHLRRALDAEEESRRTFHIRSALQSVVIEAEREDD
ncbi:hypothetical protein [Halosimplex halophilum]|uniref:hypothetical protein n=1 Tax=Halosimplex halophilum TaxID=2559572 RepID=UPI00107F4CC2|nr:hypothetical protein [Halosimplex halophilum]